jgi:hypothetical protein
MSTDAPTAMLTGVALELMFGEWRGFRYAQLNPGLQTLPKRHAPTSTFAATR